MTDQDKITFQVQIGSDKALALSQFLKRVSFSDYRLNSVDDAEAYLMIEAGELIRAALAEQGFNPR